MPCSEESTQRIITEYALEESHGIIQTLREVNHGYETVRDAIATLRENHPSRSTYQTDASELSFKDVIDGVVTTIPLDGINLSVEGDGLSAKTYSDSLTYALRELAMNGVEALQQRGDTHNLFIIVDREEANSYVIRCLDMMSPSALELGAIHANLNPDNLPGLGLSTKRSDSMLDRGYGLMIAQHNLKEIGGDIKYLDNLGFEMRFPAQDSD